MNCFVGITDTKWFEFCSTRRPDEVNFWRPRSKQGFKAINVGEPFLFKLHSPQDFIVGGGFLVRHSILPISLAWKAFELKNGAPTFEEFSDSVIRLGRRTEPDPMIGCTILAEPFFFPQEQWIPVPADWKSNIVVGKTYDTQVGEGGALWAAVVERLKTVPQQPTILEDDGPRYGRDYLTRGRLGQGSFRILVTDAYERRCAITGERTLPVLEASHIRPYTAGGPHRVSNGLLLRSDLHILFDRGYMTVTPDLRIEISGKIREEFENGREYYQFQGCKLKNAPGDDALRPSSEFLSWHNEEKFAS